MMLASAVPLHVRDFARSVREGLSKPRKELSPEYFYDDLGSALFEAITYLPEYGLTEADRKLLAGYAPEIIGHFKRPLGIVEFGSGTGRKIRPLLEAASAGGRVTYYPIDLSGSALEQCRQALAPVAAVEPIRAWHLEGLDHVRSMVPGDTRLLVLFVGSSIGNFDPAHALGFLRETRARLREGDGLLLGADLVKDPGRLILAYDDPVGVTAAFNRNVLARINRELQADFDVGAFAHQALYLDNPARIEMHLRASRNMRVSIPAADFECHFEAGESILTERSHKYTLAGIREMASHSGFRVAREWVDECWPFTESLLIAT
jgi:L-histidine N-alpha-methyltransferase